jgi:hypothetical protein
MKQSAHKLFGRIYPRARSDRGITLLSRHRFIGKRFYSVDLRRNLFILPQLLPLQNK